MGKNKKKRNKQYTGVDAAMVRPNIVRVSAVDRGKFGQWWFDNKKIAKPIIRVAAIVLIVVVIIVEIVRIATGQGF